MDVASEKGGLFVGRERFVKEVVFWLAAAVALFAARAVALPCLGPFLAGWLAAAAVRPAARGLSEATGLGRGITSGLCLGVFWLGLGLGAWWLGALAAAQGAELARRLPEWYARGLLPALEGLSGRAARLLAQLAGPEAGAALSDAAARLGPLMQQEVASLSARALGAAGGVVGRLPGMALGCSFTVLSSFFILPEYERLGAFLLSLLPERLAGPVRESRDFLLSTLRQVVKAYLLLMAVTFGEIALGLRLLGVECYLVIALAVAALDVLPAIGSGCVLIPWGVWTVLAGRGALGAGILLLYGVVAGVRAVLEPRILGGKIGLPPLATLVAMYAGMRLGGVGGMLLAPMAVTLLLFLEESGHIHFLGRGR